MYHILREFSAKQLQKSTLNDFIKRLKQTGSITRKSGSGRPRTTQTTANVDAVDELVLSQEDAPQTHSTVGQIERETHIHAPEYAFQFDNSINVGGRLRCFWPATTRLSCYRSSLLQL